MHRLVRAYPIVLMVPLIALLAQSLYSQSTELGTVAGTVTDQAGAVVPNAGVKVINKGTNVARDVTGDSQGNFAARSLVPGTYRVEVSAPGFAQQVQDNIKLDVSAAVTLDFHLTVGQVNQQIE